MTTLRVGELAARAGVTVRTLHHYDEIGLLRPARTAAGHRRYGPAEVERLQQITSLRALGVPLAEIGPAAHTLAEAEGLHAHALSLALRLKEDDNK